MAERAARALIFDCDGVLADTERYGHLVAFNQVFEEFGLPVRWSPAEYKEKLRIGGGKERMASLLTPEFVAAAGLPADPAGQRTMLATWHRRKTEIYTGLVAAGAVPPRPGIARVVAAQALDAGWRLAVASTSAAGFGHRDAGAGGGAGAAPGRSWCSPATSSRTRSPPRTSTCSRWTGWACRPARSLVVEDSRNGLRAAIDGWPGLRDHGERLHGGRGLRRSGPGGLLAGRPGGRARQPCSPTAAGAAPGDWVTLEDLAACFPDQGAVMPTASLGDVEVVVRTIAQVSVDNEKYFGDLDAVVGDGDFGYSMARGFELVLRDWDTFDRTDIGTFLKKVALVITSRIGGTSGPIWGTAFLRAGVTAGTATKLEPAQIVAMLRASIAGIKARGQSDVGDKTLLDALVPTVDTIEEQIGQGHDTPTIMRAAAVTAREHAEATRPMQAMRGRASYTGERSIGTLDAGAVAVAVMFEALADLWPEHPAQT